MSSDCIIDNDKFLMLRAYAEAHEITVDEFMQIYKKKLPIIGDRDEHILYLSNGFRFVFSIENVPSGNKTKTYKIRKLSGSVNHKGKYPHPIVMETIAGLLGFIDFNKCSVKMNGNDPIPNIEIHEIISITNIYK